ncbi:hypothetical protein ACTFJW_17075 [Clostridium cagae]|uniref:hypothetical protein n=1 Tax=Clostridium cagae TaxID=2080751 RepID=UPI003F76F048
MNKRIKFKKGILQKKCSSKCIEYKYIRDFVFITNNCCTGCKFRDDETINKLLVENHIVNQKYKRVSINKANRIINTREPKGLFWTKEGEWYTAIDNLTGDAWTENFQTRKECLDYLEESVSYSCQCFNND